MTLSLLHLGDGVRKALITLRSNTGEELAGEMVRKTMGLTLDILNLRCQRTIQRFTSFKLHRGLRCI